ncbi:MAG: MBOAT family protein [Planctomycetota bacterium]
MQFNSFAFLAFFAVVFPLYCVLNFRWQNRMLLAASYLFYGWVEPRFLCLMALTTIIDFFIGIRIGDAEAETTRKRWTVASIVMNLAILGVFKYYDFFALSIAENLGRIGITLNPLLIKVGVPAGISFYTFHEISYTVDVYRKHIRPARKFEDFAVFISFFPQLVAGPIGRASWQMPQFEKPRRMTWQGWCEGALLMLFGFFKKMAVADAMAPFAAKVFSNPHVCSRSQLLIGLYCFSIQIYADFSGYTDIARGLARLMGFDLIENFNQPYFATNITDFWRRWHISLSTWLRDYLYIPLGGNRGGKFNTYRNLFLTMFLGGLWHGASWKFAVWGSMHGIYLAAHKFMMGDNEAELKPRAAIPSEHSEQMAAVGGEAARDYAAPKNVARSKDSWPVRVVKTAVTFHLVALTWIFFTAETMTDALAFIKGIFSHTKVVAGKAIKLDMGDLSGAAAAVLVMILIIDLPQYVKRDHCAILKWNLPVRALVYATLFIWIVMMRGLENVPFIYFQF